MCHRNLCNFNAKMIYNKKKAFFTEKSILGLNGATQFYVIKCHRNSTKKDLIRNDPKRNLNVLVAWNVPAVN